MVAKLNGNGPVSGSYTQQLEIQLSVIHNYASQYLGLVIGIDIIKCQPLI